jgi:cobalt-zinc-cadmium efflux system membrane fusion protein
MKTKIFIIAVIFSFCFSSCSKKEEIPENKNVSSSDTISLTPEMNRKVKVTAPMLSDLNDEVLLAGKVSFEPNSISKVFSLANGIMTKIYVDVGAHVKRGQVLADVFSNDFANAVSDYKKAQSMLENSLKTLNRTRLLAESNISAKKDVEGAQRDYEQAQYEYERALKNLRLLGGNENLLSTTSIPANYRVVSPIEGYIIDRTAQLGTQVKNDGSQNLFTVGKSNKVLILLDLYQDQFDKVKKGDRVKIRFNGIKDSVYETSINFISLDIDPTRMTAKVRCELDNSSGSLKPEMICSAVVFHRTGSSVFLPSGAVFFDSDGKNYVFLKIGETAYLKKEVEVGQQSKDITEIKSGVKITDQVVSEHAVFLNDELKNSQK